MRLSVELNVSREERYQTHGLKKTIVIYFKQDFLDTEIWIWLGNKKEF